ncbi:MAG: UDP-N-acetylmuramoyl-tripeptide--D-alanyl-D-alanine ligase [Spirochaetia bacterium]|jgi:UDP-N-acetylmuramoyl-tripeptide--D-alanyl-D-alanine ligase
MATGESKAIESFSALVAGSGGAVVARPRGDAGIESVAHDSRTASKGCLFVALPGERTDGHEFLSEAAASGAAALLVSNAQAARRRAQLDALAARYGLGVVSVPDTLTGLQNLARVRMRSLASVTRVGVTGSNGKTTTKEIIGSLLSRHAPTAVNEGNLNSEIGLPLACFGVNPAHRYAVFEMGMNRRGEMGVLADIVRPDLALITNVGTAHIGLLGSRDAIAAEKKGIFAHFDGRQTGFLPEGEHYLAFLAEGVRGKMIVFGPGSTPGFEGSESMGLGGTLIHWEGFLIRFPLFGPHNLANALGALSVVRELGVPNAEIRDGLEAATPLFGRSQVIRGDVTVIADCYNANPDSMMRALEFLETLPAEGRRIAVLGGMRELGDLTGPAHASLGDRLRGTGLDAVLLFGAEMEHAWNAAAGGASAPRISWTVDMEELGRRLQAIVRSGDVVLLKGSRGLELERLLPRLAARSNKGDRC